MEDKKNGNKLNNLRKSGLFFLVFFLLTISITLQFKSVGSSARAGATPQENKLRDMLLKDKENYERLEEIEKKREETLDKLRGDATKNDQRAKVTMDALNNVNKKLGLLETSGPGIIVTVSDAKIKNDNIPVEFSQLIVHDMDILQITNILRNAGAEGIAVNGQRVVGNTGISCIGVVIKVNEEKIGSPYIISAIGNQDNLESAINMAGGIKDLLTTYGITVDVQREDNVRLPKFTGIYKNTYNIEEE